MFQVTESYIEGSNINWLYLSEIISRWKAQTIFDIKCVLTSPGYAIYAKSSKN